MTGSARGKLLLFGEHVAVYGHPAVGFSLPWTLTGTLDEAPGWEFPGLGPHEAVVRNLVDRLTSLAVAEGLSLPRPGRVSVTSEIPLSSGFGSSGALCAALVNLFFPSAPLVLRDRLAWQAEGLFHGTPSGIDTALALRSGWWSLDPSTRPVEASPLPDPGLVLVTGALVREGDTRSLVGSLARRKAEGEALVVQTLNALGAVSSQAVSLLVQGRAGDLPPLVDRARHGLASLGLETPALTAVLDRALACPGALAGKLSGAGGGGAFFLLFHNQDQARDALPRIAAAVDLEHWTALPRIISPTSPDKLDAPGIFPYTDLEP